MLSFFLLFESTEPETNLISSTVKSFLPDRTQFEAIVAYIESGYLCTEEDGKKVKALTFCAQYFIAFSDPTTTVPFPGKHSEPSMVCLIKTLLI